MGDLAKPETARYCNRVREGYLMAVHPPAKELVKQRLIPPESQTVTISCRKNDRGKRGVT